MSEYTVILGQPAGDISENVDGMIQYRAAVPERTTIGNYALMSRGEWLWFLESSPAEPTAEAGDEVLVLLGATSGHEGVQGLLQNRIPMPTAEGDHRLILTVGDGAPRYWWSPRQTVVERAERTDAVVLLTQLPGRGRRVKSMIQHRIGASNGPGVLHVQVAADGTTRFYWARAS